MEFRHFFHDNRDVRLPWAKAQFITQSCAGLGGIIQSSFDSLTQGNFEVLVEESRGTVVHYWHPNIHVEESWIRTDCFDTVVPHPRLTKRAQKIDDCGRRRAWTTGNRTAAGYFRQRSLPFQRRLPRREAGRGNCTTGWLAILRRRAQSTAMERHRGDLPV
jgi:hypothetical protein